MMTTESRTIAEKAQRLIRAATGEEYGDGDIVMDLCIGYAEPGYGADDAVIVFGNWNPKRFPHGDDAPLTKSESIGPRLAAALERIGAAIEWYDEWAQCGNCYRALRTSADSYSWTMYGAWTYDCELTCADCMSADAESYLEEYIGDASRAITWCGASELTALGFVQWEPGDPQTYENGWHEGQDDNPETILATILEADPDADVVFLLSEQSQFYIRFAAWVRTAS